MQKAQEGKQNPLTVVKLLWCGQGMTALVEIYNDGVEKEEADFLGLVDCGGDREYAQGALDYIARKVGARYRKLLDLVVVTQQDASHVGLFEDLGRLLQPLRAKLWTVFVAGGKGAVPEPLREFLTLLRYDLRQVEFDSPMQNSYLRGTRAGLGWISEHNGTYFRILASNLVTRCFTERAASNVLVVDNGRLAVVLPGDTGIDTINEINRIPNLGELLPPVLAFALPHLGVLATAVRNRVAGGNVPDDQWAVIEKFTKAVSPQNVAASAGPFNPFKHPAQEVIDLFGTPAPDEAHWYVSYDLRAQGAESEGWRTRRTEVGVRTTVEAFGDVVVPGTDPEAVHDGTRFWYGDIVYRFRLRLGPEPEPAATVEFVPRGTSGTPGAGEAVVRAPEP
ncbi:hypothetical protein RMN57_32900 [Kitasatospora sp. CM 4170]|uniref:hypothetical protein n=1 Tax=Kitasatospora sp. CM 4170 TaxID=3075627 RepID=UPI0028AE45A1|nr:hypothetical protein [Kitasatospora sp. CM 4170]WNM49153.1 hypothetical protein RMN57_32900 [Kitasatospora sp. CM 4170]